MTEKEICDKYKKIHDDLTEKFYQGHSISKEDFEAEHTKNWKDLDGELRGRGFLKEEEIKPAGKSLEERLTELEAEVKALKEVKIK